MYKVEAQIKNETGLHARPASLFVKEASSYFSSIKIIKNGKEYNGKSIMGLLSMGAQKGDKIIIEAEGEDEKKAAESLKVLVSCGAGE